MNAILEEINFNVIKGNASLVQEKVKEALEAGIGSASILNDGMISAMAKVGRFFEEGKFYVPEMLVAARAMQSGMILLKPYLQQSDVKSSGIVIIGTVQGDVHDIGKNLVGMMLEGAGFEIQDLGTDVHPQKFINAARSCLSEGRPVIVGMSALLTTTMMNIGNTITALKEAGIRDTVKVIVGGAPLTESFALQIGADGFAADASRAVSLVKSLISYQREQ